MKKIAIIVPGGVGDPDVDTTIPWLTDFICRIASQFDVTVYSLTVVDNAGISPESDNFRLRHIRARPADSPTKKILWLTGRLLRDHFREKYNLVHGVWSFPAGLIAVVLGKMLRRRSVVTLPGGDATCIRRLAYGNMCRPLLRKLTLWVCEHAGILVTLTHYQRRELEKHGLKREEVRVIPFGVDTKTFQFRTRKPRPRTNFIHIANLTEVKDQQTLLRAFAIINQRIRCRLRVIGPDYLNGELQRCARELGIENAVEFMGRVLHRDLPHHLHWAHLMLHTSCYEGQGVVIAEAAASGVVVCGTRVGLIADFGEKLAVSVEIGDYQGLADKVLALLETPSAINELQSNAHEWAIVHNADWTAAGYVRIYNQL